MLIFFYMETFRHKKKTLISCWYPPLYVSEFCGETIGSMSALLLILSSLCRNLDFLLSVIGSFPYINAPILSGFICLST